jgi:hypothetical protein
MAAARRQWVASHPTHDHAGTCEARASPPAHTRMHAHARARAATTRTCADGHAHAQAAKQQLPRAAAVLAAAPHGARLGLRQQLGRPVWRRDRQQRVAPPAQGRRLSLSVGASAALRQFASTESKAHTHTHTCFQHRVLHGEAPAHGVKRVVKRHGEGVALRGHLVPAVPGGGGCACACACVCVCVCVSGSAI